MNLLITGAWKCTKEQLSQISESGHSVCFMQNENEKMPVEYDWVEGVICNGLFLYHDIEKFTNLKFIQLTSAGYDRVPMDYIGKNGIEIHNAAGVYSIPMAEFALSGVLQLYKKSGFFRENQSQHEWNKCRDLIELYGKRVCIVGCGNVGTECARRFKAFGCEVTGVDLILRECSDYEKIVSVDKLKDSILEADVVVLTLPLTNETKHLFDKANLELLKEGSIIINIARGAVIDTAALIEVLKNSKVTAVLDVFEEEPISKDSPLWDMENVIITPHNSFVGDNNSGRLWEVIVKNLKNRGN